MTLDGFWQLIDDARNASSRMVEVPQRLIDVLCKMEDQEIGDFESHYIGCLHRSYDARLWLAASVIMGGCSDDTFSDFCGWLIAQGRARFESALADPDSLADLDSFDGDDGYPTLFYFGSAAPDAFGKRFAGDARDFDARMRFEALCPVPEYPPLKREELMSASEDEARAMFPKLAVRFPRGVRAERPK
jgi:Protein of unknown function (DUF4240)